MSFRDRELSAADQIAVLAERVRALESGRRNAGVTSFGDSVVLAGLLATTATSGFLYLPTCAGPPTGVPVTHVGSVAAVVDTTNDRLYVYNGAWRSVALA